MFYYKLSYARGGMLQRALAKVRAQIQHSTDVALVNNTKLLTVALPVEDAEFVFDAMTKALESPRVKLRKRADVDELIEAYDQAVLELYADEETGWNENNCRAVYRRRIRRLREVIRRRLAQAA